MRLLKLKPFSGPKRFVFKDPDTGFMYHEASETALIRRIVNYRAQNQLPPLLEIGAVLQNYWCSLSENSGDCEVCPPLKRGLLAYIKGGIALVDNLWYGKEARVDQEEADQRAGVCIQCPYNVFPDKSGFLKWSDMIAENTVGDSRSKHHDRLGNCEVCTCTLKAKVFFRGETGLNEAQKEKMREVGCWQLKDGERHGRGN